MTTVLVEDFCSWVKLNVTQGVDVHDEPAKYVSPVSLSKYWTKERIKKVLDSCELHEHPEDIRERFLRIFSVLVYIGCPRYISIFLRKNQDDLQFPRTDLPEELRSDIGSVLEEQWKFFPLTFTNGRIHKRTLLAGQILPVTYGEELRKGCENSASVRLVLRDANCCRLVHENGQAVPENDQVVFKIYRGDSMVDLYTAEADIYCRLLGKADHSITKYYGSFSYDGGGEKTPMRVIMLEYGAKGNLLQYLESTERPSEPSDILKLWTGLLELLDALHALHNVNDSVNMKAVHQDIKLENILVFPGGGQSRFDVRFKLSDFGLAELSRDLDPEGHMAIRNGGSRMYSSPECYVNWTVQASVKAHVLPKTDIWSLGAVYSEVLVWSLYGMTGIEQYRKHRQDATKSEVQMTSAGFDACFHDGLKRLAAVDDFLEGILENKGINDQVSPAIKDMILDNMLTGQMSRLDAMAVKIRAHKNIQAPFQSHTSDPSKQTRPGFGLKLVVSDNAAGHTEESAQRKEGERTPDSRYPPPFQVKNADTQEEFRQSGHNVPRGGFFSGPLSKVHGTQASEDQHVSVDRVYTLLEKKSKILSLNRLKDKIQGNQSEAVMRLPGMALAHRLINTNGGRDQIILIDNSSYMFQFREKVARTARVISYLTKGADTDGMDLYFTSDPTTPIKCSTSSLVETKIRKADPFEGRCYMEPCLSSIMSPVYSRTVLKETSIYIYTDGNWEDGDDAKSVIFQAIAHLAQRNKLPRTFMFQFIRFGNDPRGTKCLRNLDDNCWSDHDLGRYDIVDTKYYKDNVSSIVIGSITKQNDNKQTPTQLHRQRSITP